jgi:hypothetical protein
MRLSSDSLLVSEVKEEGFHIPLFTEVPVRYNDTQTKVIFLFVPKLGTFLGQDVMSKLGIGLYICQKQIQIFLNLLSLEKKRQIFPEV